MLNITPAEIEKLQARIVVIGTGGAGCNAINNMIEKKLPGVQFVAMNTDTQSLGQSRAESKIQLGVEATEGLGAGSDPDVGRAAAIESEQKIQSVLKNAHMVFITAGMGGGTGTGSAPVIARLAKEMGILTVGVVTKPFRFERKRRAEIADEGIRELQQFVDTLIVIPNENLFLLVDGPATLNDAFSYADDVLLSGVRGVTDLIVKEGKINLDFNDIKTVMKAKGKAVMGAGEASGENRAVEAATQAINNPLLEDISLRGASSVLINMTSGNDVTLKETDDAVNCVNAEVSDDALVIFGLTIDEELGDALRVSVIATGVEAENLPPSPVNPSTSVRPTPIERSAQQQAAPVQAASDGTSERPSTGSGASVSGGSVSGVSVSGDTPDLAETGDASGDPEGELSVSPVKESPEENAAENYSLFAARPRGGGESAPEQAHSPELSVAPSEPVQDGAVASETPASDQASLSPLSELRRRSHLTSNQEAGEERAQSDSNSSLPNFLRR